MLIKNFFKLFSYSNRNSNRLLYFSTNSFLQTQNNIFPSTKPKIKKAYESYYLNYLMSRMDYYSSVYDIESLFTRSDSDPKAIKLLLDFKDSQDIPENFFNEVLNYSKNELNNYSVCEMCKIIALVSKYRSHDQCRTKLSSIKYYIDQELTKKYFSRSETLKILFTLSSSFNENLKPTNFYFHYKAVLKLLDKIDSLSTQEIVQTFYCIPARDFSKVESKFFVLSYLNDIISIFNSDELGIIVQGLGKGNMTFNHESIFSSILDKTINEIENIHPIPFLSVCKVVQKFLKTSDVDSFRDFQEKLIPHFSKLDEKSWLSLIHAGFKYKILNSALKEILIKKWKECISDFTHSEIVRFIYLTVAYNIQDEELLLLAIKNLETVSLKPYNLVFVLNNLSFHRLYPKKLLDEVFSENFFNEVCSNGFRIKGKAEWWSLYCNVKLEKPEFSYKVFNSSSLNKIYKKTKIVRERMNSNFKNDKFYPSLCTIEKILKEIYGESKVFLVDVLPHFSSGIVMRFNKKSQAEEIPDVFRSIDAMCFKESLKDDHFWIFVLLLKKSDMLWGTNLLDLPHQTQCRQLEALGYKILTVKLSIFLWTLKQKNEKSYITNLMDVFLKNIVNEIN